MAIATRSTSTPSARYSPHESLACGARASEAFGVLTERSARLSAGPWTADGVSSLRRDAVPDLGTAQRTRALRGRGRAGGRAGKRAGREGGREGGKGTSRGGWSARGGGGGLGGGAASGAGRGAGGSLSGTEWKGELCLEAGGADEVADALEGVFEARDVGDELKEHSLRRDGHEQPPEAKGEICCI